MSRADLVLPIELTLVGLDGFSRKHITRYPLVPQINIPIIGQGPFQGPFERRIFQRSLREPRIYREITRIKVSI